MAHGWSTAPAEADTKPHSPGRQRAGGLLVNKVQPVYPAARRRPTPAVRLHAIISKSGSVESLEVLSTSFCWCARNGRRAQWRQAALLNGEPVEVIHDRRHFLAKNQ